MNPINIDPFSLPSVLLQNKALLPPRGAVYFVLDGAVILYIGKTQNLQNRWKAHHRFGDIANKKQILIAWLECNEPERSPLETELISLHKPFLNGLRAEKTTAALKLPKHLSDRINTLATHEDRSVDDLLLQLVYRGLLAHLEDLDKLEQLKAKLLNAEKFDVNSIFTQSEID